MPRGRLRDLGITIGSYPTGPLNAITDVPGVLVGHSTLIHDKPRIARTGITMIVPQDGAIWTDNVFAGFHVLNGMGEMSGIHWLVESGLLISPIALTNTHQVGMVRDTLAGYAQQHGFTDSSTLPVTAETWDGWLNDIDAFHLNSSHVHDALASASRGAVLEGNVGGGTGMICYDFKGGIGTASRVVETKSGPFTLGVLVQSNHGDRQLLRVDGIAIGTAIGADTVPIPWDESPKGGSIIVIIATDAPLLPVQCRRIAQRATIGVARTGGLGHNGSGDIFLAFATGNHISSHADSMINLQMLPHPHMDSLFEAVAEATEEAILNSLTMAETMIGFKGRTAQALPLDDLRRLIEKYRAVMQ